MRGSLTWVLLCLVSICIWGCGGGGGGDGDENGPEILAVVVWPTLDTNLPEVEPFPLFCVTAGPSGTVRSGDLIRLPLEDGFTGELAEISAPGPPAFDEVVELLTDGLDSILSLWLHTAAGGRRGLGRRESEILQLQVPALGGGGDLEGYEISSIVVDIVAVTVAENGGSTDVVVDVRLRIFGREP